MIALKIYCAMSLFCLFNACLRFIIKLYMSLCIPEADGELFEDNPEEYMRRDIEGSGKL